MATYKWDQWKAKLRQRIFNRLERDHAAYRQRIVNDIPRLHTIIRKGDVVLVEGRSEMSRVIKLFSSSHWSHVAMYVGDELVQPHQPDANVYKTRFGSQARHLLVEAYSGQGVVVTPLDSYRDFNIRICRPYGIRLKDMDAVVADVVSNIGRHYDDRNIQEIAHLVLASVFKPNNQRSHKACLGSCNDFQVICSGMIARAFQRVGYPIVPALHPLAEENGELTSNPYGAKLIMRHFSQILPRDFDLSPNFEVIKFNIVGMPFHYHKLWQEKLEP